MDAMGSILTHSNQHVSFYQIVDVVVTVGEKVEPGFGSVPERLVTQIRHVLIVVILLSGYKNAYTCMT
jgi:hypothetical protein